MSQDYLRTRRRIVTIIMLLGLCLIAIPSLDAASLLPGDIVVTDFDTSALIKVDPLTGDQELIAQGGNLDRPAGLTMDSAGQLIVADIGSASLGKLIKVDPITGDQTVIVSTHSLVEPVIDANGDYLVTANAPGYSAYGVKRITPLGDETWLSSNGYLESPEGICFGVDGHLLVADPSSGVLGPEDDILHINRTSGVQSVISANNLFMDPVDVAVEDADHIFVLDDLLNALLRVVVSNGSQSIVSSGNLISNPNTMAVEASGMVLITDHANGLLRIDPSDGSQSVLSSGGYFSVPQGLYVVVPEPAATGLIMIVVTTCGLLIRRK